MGLGNIVSVTLCGRSGALDKAANIVSVPFSGRNVVQVGSVANRGGVLVWFGLRVTVNQAAKHLLICLGWGGGHEGPFVRVGGGSAPRQVGVLFTKNDVIEHGIVVRVGVG